MVAPGIYTEDINMAQTGFTPILLYSTSTGGAVPTAGNLTNSTLGSELAININDGKLFYKDSGGSVQVIGWKTMPTSAGGTGLTSYAAGDLLYYVSGTALTKLAIGASTTILTSSGSAPQWTAASSISVGTASNLASGAAGSVPYQSGSGATTFLSIGTAYQAFQVNAGGTAPTWQPSATSVLTAQGDLLYASAANTLARLAKDTTATRYLSNTGSSNNPAWAQINLANGVTGVLPVANGGTNASSASITAFNNITGYTASGATGTTSTNLVFSTSPTLTTPIVATTMGVGGATAAASGAGITFPASQSASSDVNTLDDYEEGTWTATISGSTTAGTVGYDSRRAEYVKIGRLVTVQVQINTAVVTTAPTGNLLITGLPFTPTNPGGGGLGTGIYTGSANMDKIDFPANTTSLCSQVYGGNTNIYIVATGDNVASAIVQANNLATDDNVQVSVTYMTAT